MSKFVVEVEVSVRVEVEVEAPFSDEAAEVAEVKARQTWRDLPKSEPTFRARRLLDGPANSRPDRHVLAD